MSTHHTHTAPNGGWGWVVCGCSLFILGHTNGLMLAMSVMFVSWLEEFGESRGYTSWILSIVFATMYGLGPVAAGVASKIGFRATIFVGGCLTGIGFILGYFATSVLFLVISIGIISGLGCCFCYLCGIAVISAYFTTRLTIAVGIACAGVGIGGLVAAPFLNYLTETYGWRGTVLIIGAISFHICVYSLLLRPLPVAIRSETVEYSTTDGLNLEIEVVADGDIGNDDDRVAMLQIEETKGQESTNGKPARYLDITTKNDNRARSSSSVTYSEGGDKQPVRDSRVDHDNNSIVLKSSFIGSLDAGINKPSKNNINHRLFPFSSYRELRPAGGSSGNLSIKRMANKAHLSSDVLFANSINHLNTIVMCGSVMNILKCRDNESIQSSTKEITPSQKNGETYHEAIAEKPNTNDNIFSTFLGYFHTFVRIFNRNKELLKDNAFLLYSISNFLANLAYSTPVMFMVDRAVDSGLSKTTGAMLISVNGIGSIFGRIFFGAVTYRLFTDKLMAFNFVLAMAGIVTMLSALTGSSAFLHFLYAALFGIFIGGYSTLAAVATVDLMGPDKAADAFGLVLGFMGVACLLGPPFGGLLFDLTQAYHLTYITIGFFQLASALMLVPIALKRRKKSAQHS